MSRPPPPLSFSEYPAELRAHIEKMGRQHDQDRRVALIKQADLIEHQSVLHSPETGLTALVVAMVSLPDPEPEVTELADVRCEPRGWWPFRRRA